MGETRYTLPLELTAELELEAERRVVGPRLIVEVAVRRLLEAIGTGEDDHGLPPAPRGAPAPRAGWPSSWHDVVNRLERQLDEARRTIAVGMGALPGDALPELEELLATLSSHLEATHHELGELRATEEELRTALELVLGMEGATTAELAAAARGKAP